MRFKIIAAFLLVLAPSQSSEVVCAGCHPKETTAFTGSAMGQSIGAPVRTVPSGNVTQRESGTVIRITWTNGQMIHHLNEMGFRADYAIDWQIGAGKVGYSYIAKIGQYLLQSPVSYYKRYGWDVSPGFQDVAVLDFDRVLSGACLFCHSNNLDFVGRRRLASSAKIEPIGCARCHGDTRQHVNHPSRSNIVNPARLATRARDSVCEQCHLEGVARVLNPGKGWRDFHPGDDLETTVSVYVDDQRAPTANVVSQVEQLALSRCASGSGGKLWCGTCHDPHKLRSPDRTSEIRATCRSCHATLSQASHSGAALDCVRCHMPRLRPTDIAHAASTDHRILAKPAKRTESGPSGSVRAWRAPAVEIQERNLGLAELEAARLPAFQVLGAAGGQLLKGLPSAQREKDPALSAALGDVALTEGRLEEAEACFRSAFQLAPYDGEYAMYLGIVEKQRGDLAAAIQGFRSAIANDPSLQRVYLELSALYAKQGKVRDAADVLNEYLRWNPQSIAVRSALEGLR